MKLELRTISKPTLETPQVAQIRMGEANSERVVGYGSALHKTWLGPWGPETIAAYIIKP